MQFLNTILEVIFPSNCISCGASGVDLCLACLANIPEAERESAKWILPVYDYRDKNIKQALSLFKYKSRKRLARVFATILHDRMLEELSELRMMENFREPVLIPIPLSAKRYRERGYNQTELICKELVNLDKNSVFRFENGVLKKIKDTPRQAHITNRSERLKNVIGSFAIKSDKQNTEKIKNRNIILIDDITTTGATLSEAKKVLRQAGANQIVAFTIAH